MSGSRRGCCYLKTLVTALVFGLLVPSACIGSESGTLTPVQIAEFNKAVVERQRELFEQHKRMDHGEIQELFRQYFGLTPHPEELSAQDLKYLYRAAYTAAFYGPHPEHARILRSVSEELAAREIGFDDEKWLPAGDHLQATLNVLLNARLFDAAEEFATSFGLGETGWRLANESQLSKTRPSVLHVDSPAMPVVLSRRFVDINNGIKVIVSVHPECGFSRNAMEFIAKSKSLRKKLADKTVWVSRQSTTSDLDAVIDWNKDHNASVIEIAYREDRWPEFLALERTPVFYILRDGKLVQRIVGWPGPEQGDVLREALATAENQ